MADKGGLPIEKAGKPAAERKAEEDRIAAEKEFMEQHLRERRLSSGKAMFGGSGTSSLPESETDGDTKKRARTSPEGAKERKKKSKKTLISSSEEESEDIGDSEPLGTLSDVLRKMRAWFKQPTIMKMVTKPQTEKFERYLNRYEEALISARVEKAKLETRVEERSALVEIVRNTVREEMTKREPTQEKREVIQGTSYAEAAGRDRIPKVSGLKGPVLPPPKLVLIRQDDKESEEVKKKLKELVKPSQIGLKVKRLVKIKNGVMLEAETEEGVDKLMKHEALQQAGLKVGKPTMRKPLVMVYDVRAEMTEGEIKQEIFGKNMEGSDILEEEFVQEFQVRHRHKEASGGKQTGKRSHIVVECSVRVRNWLRMKGRVFIEWESCRVKDYVDVARCYKCQRYGHVAKYCNSDKGNCSQCAEEHDYKDCKMKGKPCCVNCKREGRSDAKHPATSKQCPVYEKAVKRYTEQIDYGV